MQEFDNKLPLVESFVNLKAKVDPLVKELDSLNKQVKGAFKIGSTICGNYVVTISQGDDIPPKVITQDMVGQEIKGRKGSTVLKIHQNPVGGSDV